jgi:hypothetical protein
MITGREANDAANWFYSEVVQPTVADSLKHTDSVRLGILACFVLAHMADHYFHARHPVPNLGDFRAELRKNGAFRLVDDVTNGTKHVKKGRDGRLGFEDVGAQEINMGNLRCGWPINGTEVMVEDNKNLWLLSQLTEAADEMWKAKLARQ